MSEGYILRRGALDPAAAEKHPWGLLDFFSDEESTGVQGVTVGMARIDSGSENPLHIHDNCAEIILLLKGSLSHVVGNDVLDLNEGDMLIVPAGTPHQARSVGPATAEMVIVYNAGLRGFEVVG
jgi:mannose-6-phosphate isomerase-like protein (cupin superfamily)